MRLKIKVSIDSDVNSDLTVKVFNRPHDSDVSDLRSRQEPSQPDKLTVQNILDFFKLHYAVSLTPLNESLPIPFPCHLQSLPGSCWGSDIPPRFRTPSRAAICHVKTKAEGNGMKNVSRMCWMTVWQGKCWITKCTGKMNRFSSYHCLGLEIDLSGTHWNHSQWCFASHVKNRPLQP